MTLLRALEPFVASRGSRAGERCELCSTRVAMDSFFPDQGWLRLHRDVLDALLAFKAQRALPSWDAVMQDLLRKDIEVTS
jgi:hypothetical protein